MHENGTMAYRPRRLFPNATRRRRRRVCGGEAWCLGDFLESFDMRSVPFDYLSPFAERASEEGRIGIFIERLVDDHPFLVVRMKREFMHFVRIALVVAVYLAFLWRVWRKRDDVAFHS